LTPEQQREVKKYLPPPDLHPIRAPDLPASVQRAFRERDGTLGRVIFAYRRASLYEGKQLIRTAGAIREVRLPSGEVLHTSGREVILADIVRQVVRDAPIATAVSLAGVLLLVTLAFRSWRDRAVVLAALLAGVAWMGGIGALLGIKINMLNFVVLPITLGIGVDYPVNVYRRYRSEGSGGLRRALWHTGGAVALCSLTTIIGYSSLLFADMRALSTFGLLAVVGEVTTLTAALIWMPALIQILDRRLRRRHLPPVPQPTPGGEPGFSAK
jgi:predicted RND superfamily exporter protein